MDTADDIAYAIHDVEDFYRVGVLQPGVGGGRADGLAARTVDAALAWTPGAAAQSRRPGRSIEPLRRATAPQGRLDQRRRRVRGGRRARPRRVGRRAARRTVRRLDRGRAERRRVLRHAGPAGWSTRSTCAEHPAVRSGHVALAAAQWHEVQVLKFVHHRFVLARPDLALHQRGQARLLGDAGRGAARLADRPARRPGCRGGCTTWSSWPRSGAARPTPAHRRPTAGAGPAAGRSSTSSRPDRRPGGGVLDALSGRSRQLWTDAFVL